MTSKKGISIVEAVVAMAVVFIVIFSASSIIQSSSTVITKERNQTMAVNDSANIVECYKLCDNANKFATNLTFAGLQLANYFTAEVEGTNQKVIYTYNLTYADCPFDIKVTVEVYTADTTDYDARDWQNSNLVCVVTQKDGTELYSTTYQRGTVA